MSVIARSERSAPRAGARPGADRALLPVLLIGTFAIVLDFFIVNVALPSMQATLRASASATEWFVAGYGLTFAAGLITSGRLGDRYGRRRTLECGLALFSVASVACAAAPTAGALVVARLAQGLGAALISPQVLAVIGVTYTGEQRARALSAYGMTMGLAAAGGQVLGGLLIQVDVAHLGWRSIFMINVPIGALALWLTRRHVPESRSPRSPGVDPVGAVLSAAALAALVLTLTVGRQDGWPGWAWITLAAAPALLAGFVAQQRYLSARGGTPLLGPALFQTRDFSAGLVTQLTLWCGQASFFLVLAVYLQQGRGLSALDAGLVFSCVAAGFVPASRRAPVMTRRYGRDVIAAGAMLAGVGDVMLLAGVAIHSGHGPVALLVPGLLSVGVGQGLCVTSITAIVLSTVGPERAGAASGLLSTIQQVGNSLGVATTGAIFFGALHRSVATAFQLSLAELAALLLAVALTTRLLPKGRPA